MLAIYLDPDDPTNLVECYTFSFNYVDQGNGTKVDFIHLRNVNIRSLNILSFESRYPK